MALKKSNFRFDSDFLKGKYLGEGGANDLVKDWSIYITKEIPDFEPTSYEKEIESSLSKFRELNVTKLKDWFSRLDGEIRAQLMHIDETTFDFLRYLRKDKIESIKIFFGDVNDETKTRKALKNFKEEGFNIILTKAKKNQNHMKELFTILDGLVLINVKSYLIVI